MEEITFWRAWDPVHNNYLIQGYEVKYEETFGGKKPYYKHYASHGRSRHIVYANTFKF
jgi:hypothetical protein